MGARGEVSKVVRHRTLIVEGTRFLSEIFYHNIVPVERARGIQNRLIMIPKKRKPTVEEAMYRKSSIIGSPTRRTGEVSEISDQKGITVKNRQRGEASTIVAVEGARFVVKARSKPKIFRPPRDATRRGHEVSKMIPPKKVQPSLV